MSDSEGNKNDFQKPYIPWEESLNAYRFDLDQHGSRSSAIRIYGSFGQWSKMTPITIRLNRKSLIVSSKEFWRVKK